MKLEFLADGAEACPLIRLYDFAPAELMPLVEGFSALAAGEREFVAVHRLPGVQSLDGCELFLLVGKQDRGITRLPGAAAFDCVLTAESWDDAAAMTRPFLSGEAAGYQWLVSLGDAQWLLSPDGCW